MRHCEAQGNLDRVFQGHWNGAVTENGATQLNHLSNKMKDYPIDYLYASPLSRTVATARACNRYHQLPIHLLKELIEINGGLWEGKKFASFPTIFPEAARLWVHEPWNFVAPEGESMLQVYERMHGAINMLVRRHAGKCICIVSHGCAIRNFLCYANGWPIEQMNDVDWCDNTGISMIEFDQDFSPSILCANDCSHIPTAQSTLAKQSWWKKENQNQLNFGD